MRGTTPTHSWKLPCSVENIDKVRISYVQHGEILIRKEKEDVKFEDGRMTLRLSQEETLLFHDGCDAECQAKILTVAGDLIRSKISRFFVDRILDPEVL